MPRPPTYLDHAATTPLDPVVLEAMMPFLREEYGNASSVHGPGRRARGAVEAAREQVAALIGARPSEIVFTSGGTEANNLAIIGALQDSGIIFTSGVEHEAVLETAARLRERGSAPALVPVQPDGTVMPSDLERTLAETDAPRRLVSLMHVNNEIGAVNDLRALAGVTHAAGATLHTDAVQSVGLMDVDVNVLGVDLLSLSGHKLYGPKGVGALYVGPDVDLDALLVGGPQERGRRAGTENVAGIVGLARAMEIAVSERHQRREHIIALRDRLERGIAESVGDQIILNSCAPGPARAPHIVNVSVREDSGPPVDGEMLILGLDMEGVQVSSGSACSSGAVQPSHVLKAIGRRPSEARAAVRFSIGKDTSESDVDYAVDRFAKVLQRVRHSGR